MGIKYPCVFGLGRIKNVRQQNQAMRNLRMVRYGPKKIPNKETIPNTPMAHRRRGPILFNPSC